MVPSSIEALGCSNKSTGWPETEAKGMKTLRSIKRLLMELPQPARRYHALLWVSLLVCLALALATAISWVALLGIGVAGVFAFLFGRCIYRDRNGAATFWSNTYKESRGIPPDRFTFFDVPTAKAMGFFYMLMGIYWTGGALVVTIQSMLASAI